MESSETFRAPPSTATAPPTVLVQVKLAAMSMRQSPVRGVPAAKISAPLVALALSAKRAAPFKLASEPELLANYPAALSSAVPATPPKVWPWFEESPQTPAEAASDSSS